MKKVIAVSLALCLLSSALSACKTDGHSGEQTTPLSSEITNNPEIPTKDIWDGSIAKSFADGNGSEKAPFIIKKASQLAFLAQEVNAGKDYTGKYISLSCDVDLNDIEWTPIGNGTHSFRGIFNGNDHTISNLKITDGSQFIGELSSTEMAQYAAGLFGTAWDAVIYRVKIDHVEITVPLTAEGQFITVGALVGDIRANTDAKISNVVISNARLTNNLQGTELCIGGLCGYVCGEDNATIEILQVQTEATVSIENGKVSNNRVGGLIGTFQSKCNGNVESCASYLAVEIDKEDCRAYKNYFGAIGSIFSRDMLSVSDVFSKVTINKIHDVIDLLPAYTACAIAGFANFWPEGSTGEFENVFGYVEQLDMETGERVTSMELINLSPGGIYNETNCQGCEQLPENHGLDESIWDVSNPLNPCLK